MTVSNINFYERVEDALHNNQLHTALNIGTNRFINNRNGAINALPEADALRAGVLGAGARAVAHPGASAPTPLPILTNIWLNLPTR